MVESHENDNTTTTKKQNSNSRQNITQECHYYITNNNKGDKTQCGDVPAQLPHDWLDCQRPIWSFKWCSLLQINRSNRDRHICNTYLYKQMTRLSRGITEDDVHANDANLELIATAVVHEIKGAGHNRGVKSLCRGKCCGWLRLGDSDWKLFIKGRKCLVRIDAWIIGIWMLLSEKEL